MSDLVVGEVDDDVADLARIADRWLRDHSPVGRVRDYLYGPPGVSFDRSLWAEQAGLGWTSLAVPESLGGAGLTSTAAGRLVEVCGRYLTPEPVLSTICLATPVLLAHQSEQEASRVLHGVATGELVVTVAVPRAGALVSGELEVRAEEYEHGWRLAGRATVLDIPGADLILVPAAVPGGCRWFLVDPDAANGPWRSRTLLDGRRCTPLDFAGAELSADRALGPATEWGSALDPILTTGAALVSAWLLGLAERAFELTVEYLKIRRQFGALIGSYQGLQHRASRMYCDLEVTRSVVESAIEAAAAGLPNAPLEASSAKARAGDLALHVTAEAIQLHGGIGMTEEADVGLYFKAARVADHVAGDHQFHRSRAGLLLGIDTVGDQLTSQEARHD